MGRKKLSEKRDLQDLEDQWFEDEPDDPDDLTRWKKGPDGQRVPPKQKTKSEMAFVNLRRPITKDVTTKWAAEKADILTQRRRGRQGLQPWRPARSSSWPTPASRTWQKVQRFVLKQDRVIDFEWNQKKSVPAGAEEEDGRRTTTTRTTRWWARPPDVEAHPGQTAAPAGRRACSEEDESRAGEPGKAKKKSGGRGRDVQLGRRRRTHPRRHARGLTAHRTHSLRTAGPIAASSHSAPCTVERCDSIR